MTKEELLDELAGLVSRFSAINGYVDVHSAKRIAERKARCAQIIDELRKD